MNERIGLRWGLRALAVVGILMALAGVAGYWLTRDVQHTVLSKSEARLVNPNNEAFQVSFVLAGRDYDYFEAAGPLVEKNGEVQRTHAAKAELGNRTDTVIYVNIVGKRAYLVLIPRDTVLQVPKSAGLSVKRIGINEVYDYPSLYPGDNRADHLRRAVSGLLGVPIDYYAIINIDIFKRLVDNLGGVEVDVPQRMYYTDHAAGLTIDLQPGVQRLGGEEAAGFVRYRKLFRGDIDRIDNVKALSYAILHRLQELNVRAIGALPKLVDTFAAEVETNISPALLSKLSRLDPNSLTLEAATLPTRDVIGSRRFVRAVPQEAEQFLAQLFGGEARRIVDVPKAHIVLTNCSGIRGLGPRVKAQMQQMGIPAGRIRLARGPAQPLSRVITTNAGMPDALFYADMFGVGWQQVDRMARKEQVEIILGENAREFYMLRQGGAS